MFRTWCFGTNFEIYTFVGSLQTRRILFCFEIQIDLSIQSVEIEFAFEVSLAVCVAQESWHSSQFLEYICGACWNESCLRSKIAKKFFRSKDIFRRKMLTTLAKNLVFSTYFRKLKELLREDHFYSVTVTSVYEN